MPKNKDKEDILQQAVERFKEVAEADLEERRLADEDIRFATNDEGSQWPSDLKTEREGDDRPCLVLNKIPEKIDQVEGEFKQLQPSFKVRAVDSQSDPKIAEVYSGLMRHIEYNSDAKNAYNNSHTSTLLCGRGAWRLDIVDAEDDPFVRDIIINRIPNVLTVYWDPFAKKADKSDANFMFVTELINKKEFEKDYPDVVNNFPDDHVWDNWRHGNSFRVAEYWWKEKTKQKYYKVQRMVNGMPTEVAVTELQPGDNSLEEKTVDKIKVRWCKMAANEILASHLLLF